ncbi:HAD hydrolase-like protein [Mesorhizobium sp. A623]
MLAEAGLSSGQGRLPISTRKWGGPVERSGKPFSTIYEVAMNDLGNPSKEKIVGIGDSIEHDSASAKSAEIAAALVRPGILAEFGPAELRDAFARYGATPDFLLPQFVWRGLTGRQFHLGTPAWYRFADVRGLSGNCQR